MTGMKWKTKRLNNQRTSKIESNETVSTQRQYALKERLCAVNVFHLICHIKLDSIRFETTQTHSHCNNRPTTHMHTHHTPQWTNEEMAKCYKQICVYNIANQSPQPETHNGPSGSIKWQINVTAMPHHTHTHTRATKQMANDRQIGKWCGTGGRRREKWWKWTMLSYHQQNIFGVGILK